MLLTNKAYDTLKWIAQYLLPASGTLYFALASIWGLPYGEQIIGTITALDIFLAVILGISTNQFKKSEAYSDGTLQIDTSDPAKDIYRMDFNDDLSKLSEKKTVTFVINPDAKL